MDTNLTLLVTAYHNTLVGDKDTPLRVPLKPGTDEGVCEDLFPSIQRWVDTHTTRGRGGAWGRDRKITDQVRLQCVESLLILQAGSKIACGHRPFSWSCEDRLTVQVLLYYKRNKVIHNFVVYYLLVLFYVQSNKVHNVGTTHLSIRTLCYTSDATTGRDSCSIIKL